MWHVLGEGEGSGWGLLAKPWGPCLLSPVPHAWGGLNHTPCAGPQRPCAGLSVHLCACLALASLYAPRGRPPMPTVGTYRNKSTKDE